MKLGITVVYFVKKGEGWLIDLHLKHIRQYTHVPYKIYAAAGRLLPEYKELLVNSPDVVICECGPTNEIAGKENSFYLEQLFRFAINDGCSHIAIFHVDSFPLRHDWVGYLLAKLEAGNQIAAVERLEDNDHKPHSSFIFLPVSYYLKYNPPLRLSEDEEACKGYRDYAKKFSHIRDSGYGFGYQLFRDKLSWYPLRRSNKREDHSIMAGIYDDLVFHLGGAGFTVWISRKDKIWYWRKQGLINFIFKPVIYFFPGAVSFKEKIIPGFDNSRDKKKINERNNLIMKRIKKQLITDPDKFLNSLK